MEWQICFCHSTASNLFIVSHWTKITVACRLWWQLAPGHISDFMSPHSVPSSPHCSHPGLPFASRSCQVHSYVRASALARWSDLLGMLPCRHSHGIIEVSIQNHSPPRSPDLWTEVGLFFITLPYLIFLTACSNSWRNLIYYLSCLPSHKKECRTYSLSTMLVSALIFTTMNMIRIAFRVIRSGPEPSKIWKHIQ